MTLIAKQSDLSLTEFAAFNHGRDYPRMRRWELPFALFGLRLPNTASVLDCTINPLDFGARLQSLYPHVTYRHCSPIQEGRFSPLVGVPDAAFDRVVCVNTLEHLLREQREALVAELALKMKPGGLLAFTSDFYFDSMWQREAVLKLGVIRPDGGELFNGWNRVAPREYVELFTRHGLLPLDDGDEEPRDGDTALYLNEHPYEHACVAGLFRKSSQAPRFDDSRRVALSLLTWNTRAISLESLAAHAREAAMLKRLGHEPFVIVCDNGSTDGTREALEAFGGELGCEHHFIFNPENRGSSVARNQIVDRFLEAGGDYLLFTDGDVELVAASSLALLRYMENGGRVLGCVGAFTDDYTNERQWATPYLFSVQPALVETIDWFVSTCYGMFRREVFEAGVRFDVSGPFGGPGWGFEDNDLAFQMHARGFRADWFHGMKFLHRDVRSSIPLLRREGLDPADAFLRRRQYLVEKWSGVPLINDGPLEEVRHLSMPDTRTQA
ncbi:MAG: glycosyltransferase [Acidobacteriota bacterium]|nr:glycosyltransferase [Acidobacteriota bacterium]MDQ5838254.1 glycosyltransferase [Acidobacteriota bacterium]